MIYRSLFLSLCVVLICASCGRSAPPTGYADDFTGALGGWSSSNMYSLTQADGVLTFKGNKQTMWAGEYLWIGPHDFSAHPYVNMKIKTLTPCILSVYFCDSKDKSVIVPLKIRQTTDFVNYCWDFTGMVGVDFSQAKGFIFTPNGAANSWNGTLYCKDLVMGDKAKRMTNIEGLDDIIFYRDSGIHNILLTGLKHVSQLALNGADKLVRNVTFSDIKGDQSIMRFECIPGAVGTADIKIIAQGDTGFDANSLPVKLTLEDNLPPTIDPPAPVVAQAKFAHQVRLTGISDGNISVEQPISFSVKSSNPRVVDAKSVVIEHATGSPYAYLTFTPSQPGSADLTIALDDNGGGRSTASVTLPVKAVKNWNNPPTLDAIPDQAAFIGGNEQSISLTGISDGDGSKQQLSFTVASSDPTVVIATPQVKYNNGTAAILRYKTTDKVGSAVITVTLQDHGGAPDNNGDQQVQRTVKIVTRTRPLAGFTDNFAAWDVTQARMRAEPGITISADKDGDTPIMKIACKDKITFSGLWMKTPDMDLSTNPYLTVDVKSDNAIAFNIYFYDGKDNRNSGASRTTNLPANTWKTVTFDFSGPRQMEDDKGQLINASWITQVLLNFHPRFGWPFSSYTGNLYLRNLRIGADADIPKRNPVCTMDDVPVQVYPVNAGKQSITLSGLGCGNGNPLKIAATTTGDAGLTDLTAGSVTKAGTSLLTFTVGPNVGTDKVQVSVTADGADAKTVVFNIHTLDTDPAKAAPIAINCGKTFQTIRGFGTFYNDLPAKFYAQELGASAMRIGTVDETIMDRRDTTDPDVINRSALNYKVLNFEHIRELKDAGVESFIYTCWTPPAWMKANLSTNYQGGDASLDSVRHPNHLDFYQYENFAKMMATTVRMFQEEAGVNLVAICPQNEPTFCEPYGSGILDPSHFVELIKAIGKHFKRDGITTGIFMPEQVFTQGSMYDYINQLNADQEAQQYCNIVATHGYDERGIGEARPDFRAWTAMWNRSQQGGVAKELWMSETYPEYRDWNSALNYGIYLYGSLEFGNISLWTSWSIDGQLVSRGMPNSAFYVVRQYYKFIRPGAVRVTSVCNEGNILVSSYINDQKHGGKLVSVIINKGNSARAIKLSVGDHPIPGDWQVISTDKVRKGVTMSDFHTGDILLLAPGSVTTLIEKGLFVERGQIGNH